MFQTMCALDYEFMVCFCVVLLKSRTINHFQFCLNPSSAFESNSELSVRKMAYSRRAQTAQSSWGCAKCGLQ